MNGTQKEMAIATIDVFFDSVQLVVSLARFTIALGAITYEASQATIQAGRDARIKFDAWVAEIEFNARFVPAGLLIPAVDDAPSNPEPVIEDAGIASTSIANNISAPEPEVSELGIRELRAMAKAQGIVNYSRKSKADLIQELAIV